MYTVQAKEILIPSLKCSLPWFSVKFSSTISNFQTLAPSPLTCDSGTNGMFLAASHNTCFVLFPDIPSSSGMWLCSVKRRTIDGSVKSMCARPGQPGMVGRQCCLAGYLLSFRKEYPLRRSFVPPPDVWVFTRPSQVVSIYSDYSQTTGLWLLVKHY